MKRIVILLMLVIMALSIISCDKRDGDSGVPTLAEVVLDPDEDFYLILEYGKDLNRDDTDVDCSLITNKRLEGLWINTDRVNPDYMNYSNLTGYYWYEFDLDYLNGALPSAFNEEIVYQIKLEGKTVTGSLVMPAEYVLNPPSFDPAQNYEVDWTLADDPQAQSISLSLEDTDRSYYYNYGFVLKPTKRTHSFNKSLWSDYQPDEDFDVYLEASNYQRTNGGVVWFISSYRYEEYHWNTKSPHQQRIEKLLRGENPLPK
jgi:hypothetical protein